MEYSRHAFVSRVYSVPRRFDVATMLVVTLAYALLFGVLRSVRIQSLDVVKVAGFFTCVAIGQAMLFRGKRPRISSVMVGVVYIVAMYGVRAITRDASLLEVHYFVLMIWLVIAMAGAISGYFAGVAIGAVFLLSDVMRRSIRRHVHRCIG